MESYITECRTRDAEPCSSLSPINSRECSVLSVMASLVIQTLCVSLYVCR